MSLALLARIVNASTHVKCANKLEKCAGYCNNLDDLTN